MLTLEKNERIVARNLLKKMSEDYNFDGITDRKYLREVEIARAILWRLRSEKRPHTKRTQLSGLKRLKIELLAEVIYHAFEDAGCFVHRGYRHENGIIQGAVWHLETGWYALECNFNVENDLESVANQQLEKLDRIGFVKGLMIHSGSHSHTTIYTKNEYNIYCVDDKQFMNFLINQDLSFIFGLALDAVAAHSLHWNCQA